MAMKSRIARAALTAGLSIFAALAITSFAGTAVAGPLTALSAPGAPASAAAPRFEPLADGGVRFRMSLSAPLEHHLFTLAEPNRLVVDFPEIKWGFHSNEADASAAEGVEGLRVGLFRVGRSRLVIDLAGAPEIMTHEVRRDPRTGEPEFIVDFAIAGIETSDIARIAQEVREIVRPASQAVRSTGAPMRAERPSRRPKPIVVAIDAGHGGGDSGARYGGLTEKALVLDIARRVRAKLSQPGRVSVFLTRDRDEFIRLDQRVARARDAGADLFISLHADALPSHTEVAGASVYTLSERASDKLSARLARRENAADAIAGMQMAGVADDVRQILVDYRRRQMMDESHGLANLMVRELRKRVRVLQSRPHRHAGFRVLKSFDMPSVLVELGFLTNIRDRRAMANEAWRDEASASVAEAVRAWARGEALPQREAALQQ